MIKKLRRQFIISIMLIFTITLLIIFGTFIGSNIVISTNKTYQVMEQIASQEDFFGFGMDIFGRRDIGVGLEDYLIVKMSSNNVIYEISVQNASEVDADAVVKTVNEALSKEKSRGVVNDQFFVIKETLFGRTVVFSGMSSFRNDIRNFIITGIIIQIISLGIVYLIALYLSKRAIKPVEIAFEKQKRFISDASHELKTPLTVISTNVDVLKNEIGTNKWLDNIQVESKHMSKLVTDLLYLSKYSDEKQINKNKFDLSEALLAAVLPFDSVAYENNKELVVDVPLGLSYEGDEFRIKQLAIILVDNAIKNSLEHTKIYFCAKKENNKTIITVSNEGAGIKEEDKEKIFERFYKSDDSRSTETGGFGLGLAIAKQIVEEHNGKISVDSEIGKTTTFKVIL